MYFLSILSFMDHVFDVISKKSLPYPQSSRFSYMFASSSFIVLCFIFRSMIYEFILCVCVNVQLFLNHLLSKIGWYMSQLLGSVFCYTDLFTLSPTSHYLDDYNVIVSLEVRQLLWALFFFFSGVLNILDLLPLYIHFIISLSMSTR